MVSIKLSNKLLVAILAILTVIIIGVVVFSSLNETSTARIEPPAPSYAGESKIFVLSADSRYGYEGFTHCFIVNLTVRNDYTPQNPVDNERDSRGAVNFILYARLYDRKGNLIPAQVFNPGLPPNYNVQYLSSGETGSLTVTMVTATRDVDYYTLIFGYLGSIPPP